ncbi:YbaB/EbfC family nucleoid-associated protein [Woeseiaceae bacterium]|jgi:nucleoid-associated protein EbfC|nr:YbaB/EbfC family nucleoid-associated protein [Woeseiaceae bacterium]MDB2544391.1 YbaB/EbfC family nucleoid-associated protein [Woeseiaceae bacterium]|tara:strand:- start:49 stop:372 length:324 start_codon:yes stop_codon:yes gene_type:complete
MKGGIGQLMKQAQEMQENMKKAQDELSNITVTGESGGGMVTVTMSCKHEIKALKIDDLLLSDDKDMLEDLIIASFNDAIRRVEKKSQESLSGMTAGLNLPPGMKLPF